MKIKRTTSYISYDGRVVPYIRLSGSWLKTKGFDVGSDFQLLTENNKIILQPIIGDKSDGKT